MAHTKTTKHRDDDVIEAERLASFTLIHSAEVLSKSYRLNEAGELEKYGQGGRLSGGNARTINVRDLHELAELLPTLDAHHAICWGVPTDDDDAEPYLLAADQMVGRVGAQNPGRKVRSRKKENFEFQPGERGVFMGDIDDVAPGQPPLKTAEAVLELIREALPELAGVEIFVVPSGSACIKNGETGEMLRGITGWRFYFIIENAADIPRLGKNLFKRLWLINEGYIKPASNGSALVRAPVDALVWQGSRLDFIGGAKLEAPLVQDRPKPRVFPGALDALDSRLVADLTAAEEAEYTALVEEAKEAMRPELEQKATEAVEKQVARRVKPDATEAERDRVRQEVRLTLQGETLPPEHVIEVHDKGVWREVSVAEIVADRDAYHGMDTRDPYDPAYDGGRIVGRVFVNPAGVWLKSFAHGERTFGFEGSEPADGAEQIALLGAKLKAVMGEDEFIAAAAGWVDGQDEQKELLARWTEEYVVFPGGKTDERVCSTVSLDQRFSKDGFRDKYWQTVEIDQGVYQKGGTGYEAGDPKPPKKVRLTDIWLNSELPRRIDGYRYLPGNPERVTKEDGRLWLNTYTPPVLGTYRPEHEWTFEELLDHLFDHPEERAYVENWLAFKFQNLRSRGTFNLLVSPKIEGTGRGTLFTLLSGAFGLSNCEMALPSAKVVGRGSASEYNDWQIDHVFATIDELATTGSSFGGKARTELTEKLKTLFEVSPGRVRANPKYGRQRTDYCYVSAMAATNEIDAIVLDPQTDNRRFAIHSTGGKGPLTANPALFAKLAKVRNNGWIDPDMSATIVHRYSLENWGPADEHAFLNAPTSQAKETMVDASTPGTYEVIAKALHAFEREGRRFVEVGSLERRAASLAGDAGNSWTATFLRNDIARAFSAAAGFEGWHRVPTRLKVVGGNKVQVITLGEEAKAAFARMSLSERSEALERAA